MRGWIIALLLISSVVLPGAVWGESGGFSVVVSIGSLASIVREICGDVVEVSVVLPEGADPHSYALTQEDYDTIERANMLVFASTEHIELEAQIREAFPDKPAVDYQDYATYGAEMHPLEGVGDENFHGYWMYPTNALAIAKAVTAALSALDPVHEKYFAAKLEEFQEGLMEAWAKANATLEERGTMGAGAVVAIPGVAYIAETLGLDLAGTIMKAPGVFVQGSEMDAMLEDMRSGKIRYVVCPEEMRDTDIGESARELAARGGASVIYVRTFSGGFTYLEMLYYNLGASSVPEDSPRSDPTPWIVAFLISMGVAVVEAVILLRWKREVVS